jgi:hypothetical protein
MTHFSLFSSVLGVVCRVSEDSGMNAPPDTVNAVNDNAMLIGMYESV